ncbi:MAG: hypothetical protein P1V20_27785 [Verrucomicrobiales bacterium]|nr:hypothetical protein [Verrucomicrobiales bacterium]
MHSSLLTIQFVVGIACLAMGHSLVAQTRLVSDVDQRTGPRAEFQKPLAWEIGGYTALVEGALITGGQYLHKRPSAVDIFAAQQDNYAFKYDGLFDFRLAKKLPNTFAYGFEGRLLVSGIDDNATTQERFDVYIENFMGRFSFGNFDDRDLIVYSARNVLAGEADLFYDGFFAPSTRRAFRFRTRLSSYLLDGAIDENGDSYNFGIRYGSPSDYVKKFWSLNYQGGDLFSRYHRNGISAGYLISYGSLDFALGISYDHLDPYSNFASFDRIAGSAGISYKQGRTTVSAGALAGETNNGNTEVAYTTGMRYDFVRGMSLNLGYFYIDSDSTGTDGGAITPGNVSGARSSLSYRF